MIFRERLQPHTAVPSHYYNRPRWQSRRRPGISNHRVNPAWKFLLPLFGIWVLLYGSFSLLRPPLFDGRGTVHAEIAREMVLRHDWSAPYVNGVATNHTPSPHGARFLGSRLRRSRLLDWSIASSFRIFGVSDWAARLPTALAVFALATIAFFVGRRLFLWNAAGL
jgi:4-amino-4-deoxy-L-arabinose transferase-like glycosyltransferase